MSPPHVLTIWWTSPTSCWDLLASLGHPIYFQRVLRLGSITARPLVVGVSQLSQTLRPWQRAPPIFGRAAITLGISPHSSCSYYILLFRVLRRLCVCPCLFVCLSVCLSVYKQEYLPRCKWIYVTFGEGSAVRINRLDCRDELFSSYHLPVKSQFKCHVYTVVHQEAIAVPRDDDNFTKSLL